MSPCSHGTPRTDRVILPVPGHQWRDTVYHFEYDNFDNTTSISIGSNEEYILASYVYAAKNGLLTTQTYGNGDKVEFTYDILGRTKTATYSDSEGEIERVLTYVYTGDGQLYSIHDSSAGYTYLYTYDNIGRLIASSVKNGSGTFLMSTRQEYSANNQLIAQHWTVGGTTYSETYTYSKTDGALTSSTNVTGDGTVCFWTATVHLDVRTEMSHRTVPCPINWDVDVDIPRYCICALKLLDEYDMSDVYFRSGELE